MGDARDAGAACDDSGHAGSHVDPRALVWRHENCNPVERVEILAQTESPVQAIVPRILKKNNLFRARLLSSVVWPSHPGAGRQPGMRREDGRVAATPAGSCNFQAMSDAVLFCQGWAKERRSGESLVCQERAK